MGLFKKAHVRIFGEKGFSEGTDGRYEKQAKINRLIEREKEKMIVFHPETPEALAAHILALPGAEELERTDERYESAFLGVKDYLAEEYAWEQLKTKESDAEARFQEAVSLPESVLPVDLHVFNIPIRTNSLLMAWLEVYVEYKHAYLAFKPVALEEEADYMIHRTEKDLINFFGVSEEDRKARNDRYIQYLNVQ